MKIEFPSREFELATAAVCHGTIKDAEAQALNRLLRVNVAARDEYILRVEIHSRLASKPELFAGAETGSARPPLTERSGAALQEIGSLQDPQSSRNRKQAWVATLAACLMLSAVGWWHYRSPNAEEEQGLTSNAVAMLDRVVNVVWETDLEIPRVGSSLEPGQLRLRSGLVQVVFYSGARVTIQGPSEFCLLSQDQASLVRGRLVAEVPTQAKGFRVETAQAVVKDLGTSFGLEVNDQRTDVHVFKGSVELLNIDHGTKKDLREGDGVVIIDSSPPQYISAQPAAFASLFKLEDKSFAEDVERFSQWCETSERLNHDPSLLVHLDFQNGAPPDWMLQNAGNQQTSVPDATVVGCQWTSGRWPGKRALEFQSVNDRVRLNVPGELESLTLAAWVRVQGLDRKINSLFMSDGFAPGTIHWLIRNDGVLGLTIIGSDPRNYQIVASPPVLTLDQFGMWLHLAVVLDGAGKRVTHYVNGLAISERNLRIEPPFHIGPTELGNWNPRGFRGDDPFHIRNFSGAMDEFFLFGHALDGAEIDVLYSEGEPQPDSPISTAESLRTFSTP